MNAGLRWDYESPVVEDAEPAEHRVRHDVDQPVPGAGRVAAAADCCLRATASGGRSRRDLNNIQPRIGATFRVDDKTVLRGGYALAYLPTFDTGYNNGFSVTTTLVASTDGGITPVGRLSNPYPGRPGSAGRRLAGAGHAGRPRLHVLRPGADHPVRAPVLGRRAARAARTAGARGARTSAAAPAGCRWRRGSTRSPPAQLAHGQRHAAAGGQPVPGPAAGHALQRRDGAAPAAAAAVSAVRRRSPRIAGRSGVNDYDSLQLSVNKRLSTGLQFLVSYTFSRTEEEVTYLNAQDDWNQLARVVTAADTPHRLLVSSTYAPAVLRRPGGVLEGALGGWQMNGIVTFQSGLPVATTAGRVPRRRSDARQPDAGALVQHLRR